MTMPNFLIMGAAKSGTTSLYYYLKQHPQIFMSPQKEPKFFALEGEKLDYRGPGDQERMIRGSTTNLQDYLSLFQNVTRETAIGEASTLYLYSPKAAEKINQYIPKAKLIAILRNPVERAYSNFLHMIRANREPITDFDKALEQEEKRIRENWMPFWHYRQRGFYYRQLSRYFDIMDRDQIRVYLYEDLVRNPDGLMRDIFQLLGVAEAFTPDISVTHNISGVPKNKAFHNFLTEANPVKSVLKFILPTELGRRAATKFRLQNLAKPTLSAETRRRLTMEYREDIERLQGTINRDLKAWLE